MTQALCVQPSNHLFPSAAGKCWTRNFPLQMWPGAAQEKAAANWAAQHKVTLRSVYTHTHHTCTNPSLVPTWTCYNYEHLAAHQATNSVFFFQMRWPDSGSSGRFWNQTWRLLFFFFLLTKFKFIGVPTCFGWAQCTPPQFQVPLPFVWKRFGAASVFHNRNPSQNWPNRRPKIY